MRLVLSCLTCLLIPSILSAQDSNSAADESAIRELVKQYVDAREHPDAQAIERLFTPDADQLVSSGEWRKGRAEVVSGSIASSKREAGHRTITIESIRFLAPTVAIADGKYELTGRKMWTTLLLKRGDDGWRIAGIRNMLPAPPAPSK
jgi:uncharacterized protein (TIGR02246 family)